MSKDNAAEEAKKQNAADNANNPIESFKKFIENIAQKKCAITGKEIDPKFVNNLYANYQKNRTDKFEDIITIPKNEEEKIVLNNAIFLWCLPNNRKSKYITCESFDNKKTIPEMSVAGGGSGYVQTKVKGVCFILYILSQIWGIEENKIRETIIEICNGTYKNDPEFPYTAGKESLPDGVKNLLMHLCNPKEYEPIASTADKEKIVKCFYDLATLNAAVSNLQVGDEKIYLEKAITFENGLTEAIKNVEKKKEAVEKAKEAVENAGNQEPKEVKETHTKAKEELENAKKELKDANEKLENAKLAKSNADNLLTLDRKIVLIKKYNPIVQAYKTKYKIENEEDLENGNKNESFSFYNNILQLIWKGESNSSTLSRAQLLEYKKAMVLYGPPGTGKTYTAMELAKQIQIRYILSEYKKRRVKAEEIFTKAEELYKNSTYYLQFHVNYTYENFIAGQTVKTENNNNTTLETKCGFIYDIIDKANKAINTAIEQKKEVSIIEANNKIEVVITEGNCKESQDSNNKEQTNEEKTRIENIKKHITKNKELQKAINAAPFIVILDEMNRVDVSRVFGELFTAIEKRGTDVFLTLPDSQNKGERLKLNIPYNIYFIGTMNEIDFSLEQIDFALRRRFIWELANYSENALEEIITENIEETGNFTNFLNNCTALNKNIAEKLGEEYHIGHAFFAEIANIYNELKENGNFDTTIKQAQNILWQISIRPTIEAYCGTMEKNAKKAFIDDCYKVFFFK